MNISAEICFSIVSNKTLEPRYNAVAEKERKHSLLRVGTLITIAMLCQSLFQGMSDAINTSSATTMEAKLKQFSSLSQKDKGPAFISLISEILSQSDAEVSKDLHTLVDTVVNQDNVGLVVGRQVLSELVKILGEGAIKNPELRKHVVVDTLATIQPRIVSYEEQVSSFLSTVAIVKVNLPYVRSIL